MPPTRNGVPAHAFKKRKLAQPVNGNGSDEINSSHGDGKQSNVNESVRHDAENVRHEAKVTSSAAGRNGAGHNAKSISDSQVLSSGGMGKSTMMTLQINELLSEVRPNYEKQLSQLEATLTQLKQIIESLPDLGPLTISEAERALTKDAGVKIPFSQPWPSKDSKYTFEYRKPVDVNVVGRFPLKLNAKGENVVDMTVTMPQQLFQEKDYLNHRVFHKRAYYLARLAAGIRNAVLEEYFLSFALQDGIEQLPVLLVSSTKKSPRAFVRSKFIVRILVAIPNTALPIEKTVPTKNCIRSTQSGSGEAAEATPFYNTCVRSTTSHATFQSILHKATLECDAFRDVCLLGHVWLSQRGFDSLISQGGFGGFEWGVVCALLLKGGGSKGGPALSNKYNTLQLFKAVIQFFAGKDLTEPMVLNAPNLNIPTSQVPTLYDGRTGVNVLFKMQPWSYQLLRREASLSVKAMNTRSHDNFDSTFIIKSDEPLLLFDEVFHIDVSAIKTEGRPSPGVAQVSSKMYDFLRRGLGDRVELVHLSSSGTKSWDINSHASHKKAQHLVSVGLLLVPANASRVVDHGPSADDQRESKEFREFWGEKAELRRFKDGSISESLIWSEASSVTQQIIDYVLQHHLGLPTGSVTPLVNKFDHLLTTPNSPLQPSNEFKLMNDAYQSLVTQLYQLEGMPLSIRSISPADRKLRYASLSCPLTSSHAMPADVLIQFEGSSRWPDSLPAIQHTKIAFLVKLGDLLAASDKTISTRIGLENTSSASSGHLNTSYLDIIHPSSAPTQGIHPISFRLRIHHERTLTLLEHAISISHTPTLTTALTAHKRIFLATPIHTTTFANLCTRFTALSSATRLLKKWAASHLLTLHLPSEILELFTAYTFLHPFPHSTPSTPQTAFLRTLRLISRWDWAVEPLILDLSDELTPHHHAEIRTRFDAWRAIDPAMNNVVLFFATNIDPTGVAWTQGARPSKVIAARFSALAKASVELVTSRSSDMQNKDWASLFKSPLTDFDFLIHLKKDVVKGRGVAGIRAGGKYKNLTLHEEMDEESIGYDPVQLFLDDLESVLGQTVLFFYDGDGGRVIAGLWNPRTSGPKAWRVRLGYSSMPTAADASEGEGNEKDVVVINRAGILAEVALVGEGLIERIEVVRELGQ